MIIYYSNWQSVFRICSNKAIKNKDFFFIYVFFHFFVKLVKFILWKCMIYLAPVYVSMGFNIIYNIAVVRRPASVFSCSYRKRAVRCKDALVFLKYIINNLLYW